MHVSYDDWHVPTRDASPPFVLAFCLRFVLVFCAGVLLEMPRRGTRRPHLGLRFELALCACDLLAFYAGNLPEMPRHVTRHPQPCSQKLLFNLITL